MFLNCYDDEPIFSLTVVSQTGPATLESYDSTRDIVKLLR